MFNVHWFDLIPSSVFLTLNLLSADLSIEVLTKMEALAKVEAHRAKAGEPLHEF